MVGGRKGALNLPEYNGIVIICILVHWCTTIIKIINKFNFAQRTSDNI